jgi:hypothetical protein
MSIGSAFRGTFTVSDSTIEDLNIFSSLFLLFRSDFTLDNVNISNITLETGATGRLFRIEASSVATIQNSTFEDVNFQVMTLTQSLLQIRDSYIRNVTASRYIIELDSSDNIIFDNLTIYDSRTNDRNGMINFRN